MILRIFFCYAHLKKKICTLCYTLLGLTFVVYEGFVWDSS